MIISQCGSLLDVLFSFYGPFKDFGFGRGYDPSAPPPHSLSFRQVLIQLMDFDNMNPDDYAGCLFLDLGSCPIVMDQNNIPSPPTPTWMPFFLEKPGDSSGELLVSYQVPVVSLAYRFLYALLWSVRRHEGFPLHYSIVNCFVF